MNIGWMENRVRMVTASFLVKELMLDWRKSRFLHRSFQKRADATGLGEKYFMESFIDGDLAANNGGWQWTASVSFPFRNDGSRACTAADIFRPAQTHNHTS